MPDSNDERRASVRDVGHVPVELVGDEGAQPSREGPSAPSNPADRALAAACYVVVPVAVVVLVFPAYAEVTTLRAHALQAVGLWIAILVAFVVPCVGTLLGIAGLAVAAVSGWRVWRGENLRLPIVWSTVRRFV